MGPADLQSPELDAWLDRILAEDIGTGDATTEPLVGPQVRAQGTLVARAEGVLCGVPWFAAVFRRLDPAVEVEARLEEGAPLQRGALAARVRGSARALLAGERTALNLVQRLSGIATCTRRFVDAARGRVRVLDTRKTTPGMRALEKYAVRTGGGENHRLGLFDQAMVKDNHVDLTGRGVGELVAELRRVHGERFTITAEARDEAEALAAIRSGADVVLLDNLGPDALASLVPRLRAAAASRARPLELEASGGIDLDSLARYAESGVDRVSIGALTHSAPALDLALELEAAR